MKKFEINLEIKRLILYKETTTKTMTNSSLTIKHCASAAALWLQGVSSIFAPVMEGSVSGFATKYGSVHGLTTGIEIDRMMEVRG